MAIKSVLLFIYFFIFASPCYAHLFILTYGDDFTEGYVGHSQIPLAIAMTPYGKTMEQYLNKKIESFEIIQKSKFGYTVQDMTLNIKDILSNLENENRFPKYITLLAGAHDLRKGRPAHKIIEDLTSLYKTLEEKNIHTIAMTIPHVQGEPFQQLGTHKYIVNQFIRKQAKWKSTQITLYDSAKKYPYSQKFYSDSMHFNQKTYERIGKDLAPLIWHHYKKTKPLNSKEDEFRSPSLIQKFLHPSQKP